jgi:hypothetical protein
MVLDLRARQLGAAVSDDPQWKQARRGLDELQ